MSLRAYLINILGSLTQGLNSLLGGDRDQSFSSRSYEAKLTGKAWGKVAVFLVDALFYPFGGSGHCKRSYEADTERTYNRG